ncbi:MAG TPA: MBL fold metallo-hydrolase [Deltaproteobacteria bacterium]|nr:MBL fold metallo-hydrolase [Deltaproteobacteria bacterium]
MIVRTIVVTEFMTNCYIVGEEKSRQCLVIDPGGEADRILERVAADGLEVRAILATHAHVDHIGAVSEIREATGAPVYLHSLELPIFQAASRMARIFGIRVSQPADPDRFLAEGDVVSIDSAVSLTVVETPGHSPGGVSFVAGDGLCFAGDTLFAGSIGRTDLPGGSYRTLISSIKNRLLPLGDHVKVLPGHGPATTLGAERMYNPFLVGG